MIVDCNHVTIPIAITLIRKHHIIKYVSSSRTSQHHDVNDILNVDQMDNTYTLE